MHPGPAQVCPTSGEGLSLPYMHFSASLSQLHLRDPSFQASGIPASRILLLPRAPVKHFLNSPDSHLDHTVVRLLGRHVLHPHPRPAQKIYQKIIAVSRQPDNLIRYARDQRQEGDPDDHPQHLRIRGDKETENDAYDHDKKEKITFEKKQFNKAYTFCVTVDNFNTFEAGIEKINFLKINSGTIAISIDDLEIYEKYFESPLYFMHFLEQRKEATKIKQLTLRDELDHLGMYIAHNVYSKYVNEFEEGTVFTASGYRQDLDYYFASLHCEEIKAIKPMQKIPERIQEIISFVEKSDLPSKVSFTSFLLNFSTDAKDEFSGKIDYVLNRQRQTKYMAPLIAFGEAAYGCFIKQPGVAELSEEKQLEYMYANMLKVGKKKYWYILLTFDVADVLMDVSYKELSLDNIEKDGYVSSQLMERAEEIFQNRVRMVLEKEHRKKIYPNDMCPCGSGRKYKKCCGKSK